jgi:hypothetical protein
VQEVKQEFDPVMRALLVSMRSKFLKRQDQAPYINQLYERLNYNGFLNRFNIAGPQKASTAY